MIHFEKIEEIYKKRDVGNLADWNKLVTLALDICLTFFVNFDILIQGQASGMDGTLKLIFAISKNIRDSKKFIKILKHLQKLCKIPKFEGPGSKIKRATPICILNSK